MIEKTFDWLKQKAGISDEQVSAWESEEKAAAIAKSESLMQSLRDQLKSAEDKHAELTAVPEAPAAEEAPSDAPAEETAQG